MEKGPDQKNQSAETNEERLLANFNKTVSNIDYNDKFDLTEALDWLNQDLDNAEDQKEPKVAAIIKAEIQKINEKLATLQ